MFQLSLVLHWIQALFGPIPLLMCLIGISFSLVPQASAPPQREFVGVMNLNWIQRKIHRYNVTFGLFMLDWWERCIVNTVIIVLMWFIYRNTSRFLLSAYKWCL